MPPVFTIFLLIGYLIGLTGALLIDRDGALTPLAPYLIASGMAAVAMLCWNLLRLLAAHWQHAPAPSVPGSPLGKIDLAFAKFQAPAVDQPPKFRKRAPVREPQGSPAINERVAVNLDAPNRPSRKLKPKPGAGKSTQSLSQTLTAAKRGHDQPKVAANPTTRRPQQDQDALAGHRSSPGELAALISILEAAPTGSATSPEESHTTKRHRQNSLRQHADRSQRSDRDRRSNTNEQTKRASAGLRVEDLNIAGPLREHDPIPHDRHEPVGLELREPRAPKREPATTGPELPLSDILTPAIALQPVRTLPQRKLAMIDLDLKGGAKSRMFWQNEDRAALAVLDRGIIGSAIQSVQDLVPGHPAQAVLANISQSSMSDHAVIDGLVEFAAMVAGSHIRGVVLVSVSGSEMSDLRRHVPSPLEVGLMVQDIKSYLPQELVDLDISTIKTSASDTIPADAASDLDRSQCLRIDGMASRGIDLIITGIDRNQILLNLLDYPAALGQGLVLGSQTIPISTNQNS